MSSLNSLSPRELERLSAYVDGELAPSEADSLRARLERDAALRQALAELRGTAELLGSLPQLMVPRSFALAPERAEARRWYPRLQLATALASLAFVLVVGADVLGSSALHAARLGEVADRVAAPLAQPEMLREEPQAAAELPAAEEPLEPAPMVAVSTPEAEAARSAQVAPTATVAVTTQAAEAPAPAGTATPPASYADVAATSPPADEALETGAAPETAGQPELGEAGLEAAKEEAAAEPVEGAGQAGEETAQPNAQVIATESEAAELRAAEPAEVLPAPAAGPDNQPVGFRAEPGLTVAVRLLEIGLGATAIGFAALTVRSRRRM